MFSKKLVSLQVETKPAMSEDKLLVLSGGWLCAVAQNTGEYEKKKASSIYGSARTDINSRRRWNTCFQEADGVLIAAMTGYIPARRRKTNSFQRYCRHSPGDDFLFRIPVQIYDSLV